MPRTKDAQKQVAGTMVCIPTAVQGTRDSANASLIPSATPRPSSTGLHAVALE